jgi:hypothetical protein
MYVSNPSSLTAFSPLITALPCQSLSSLSPCTDIPSYTSPSIFQYQPKPASGRHHVIFPSLLCHAPFAGLLIQYSALHLTAITSLLLYFSTSLHTKSQVQHLTTPTSNLNQRSMPGVFPPIFVMRAPSLPPATATSGISSSSRTIIQSQTSRSSTWTLILASDFVLARHIASQLVPLLSLSRPSCRAASTASRSSYDVQ